MSFLRHAEIYRSDVVYKTVESLGRAAASRWSAPGPAEGRSPRTAPCSSSAMSFRAGYSLAGCSPAEPASASPTALSIHCGLSAGNDLSANGNLSLVSVPQHRGAVHTVPNPNTHKPTAPPVVDSAACPRSRIGLRNSRMEEIGDVAQMDRAVAS
jgi:hypothetical protein